jgi:hypothetical protein
LRLGQDILLEIKANAIARRSDGDPIQMKGYWGAVIVREGDVWKFRMLTWNITPAPPAATK